MKRLLLALIALGVALVLWGPLPGLSRAPREWRAADHVAPVLPMRFDHDSHGTIPCATCHHDFLDRNRGGSCINCHLTDAKIAPLFRQKFHQLCQSCHIHMQAEGKAAGPTRRCIACHQADTSF